VESGGVATHTVEAWLSVFKRAFCPIEWGDREFCGEVTPYPHSISIELRCHFSQVSLISLSYDTYQIPLN
jgi:hypothetical protein